MSSRRVNNTHFSLQERIVWVLQVFGRLAQFKASLSLALAHRQLLHLTSNGLNLALARFEHQHKAQNGLEQPCLRVCYSRDLTS